MNRHVAKPLAVAGVLGVCAFAVPTASALQDQAGPDPQNQAPVAQQAADLRSPDAQDAAGNTSLRSYPVPTVLEVHPSNGFDWDDAGIGAGGMLAAIVLVGGATLLITRRRPGRSGVSPAAG
jgi:hypothetical protein